MKAMILAAGRGERMRPLTDHTPKPLLEAGGKALIVWHIERLARAGITELVINHAHLGAQIEAALGDGSRLGVKIQYSPESRALETAGGIANALPMLGKQVFAVINGDIYCDYDFARLPDLASRLIGNGDAAHLVLVNNPAHHPNGDFCLTENRITSFHTPTGTLNPESRIQNPDSLLTFSGIGLYHPALFGHIPRGSIAPLAPLLRTQIELGKISGEHHAGLWVDVGTPQRLQQLDTQLRMSHA
ncbi:MAG: nucleotidyltransferase family protein [Proteobacteria bacterium]|nr:nucleotidyltransferase family protein [Pseudomonadota bacterium]